MTRRLFFRVFCAVASAMVLLFAKNAGASAYHVSPVSVELSASSTSSLLTVRNESPELLRLQVSAFAWDQSPGGEVLLSPTTDLVFYPAMLSLKPGETRKLRVGVTVPAGAREKTYRIIAEELPPLASSSSSGASANVRVLTKMSIPVFFQPTSPAAPTVAIGTPTLKNGTLSFSVTNKGNARVMAQKARVIAKDASGRVVEQQEVKGWYVLAGGVRTFETRLSAKACSDARAFVVEVDSEPGGTVTTPAAALQCTNP